MKATNGSLSIAETLSLGSYLFFSTAAKNRNPVFAYFAPRYALRSTGIGIAEVVSVIVTAVLP
jgi:hypothetical protein